MQFFFDRGSGSPRRSGVYFVAGYGKGVIKRKGVEGETVVESTVMVRKTDEVGK